MKQFFTAAVLTATVASGVRLATPFLLASLGETLGQRSGVLNLGVDGIMLLGGFGAYYTALHTHDLWLAGAVGVGVGAVLGLVTAVVNVSLKAQQGISGIGVYLFGLGLSDLLFVKLVGTPVPVSAPLFAGSAKGRRYIRLAQGFAQQLVCPLDATLPARLLLFHTV